MSSVKSSANASRSFSKTAFVMRLITVTLGCSLMVPPVVGRVALGDDRKELGGGSASGRTWNSLLDAYRSFCGCQRACLPCGSRLPATTRPEGHWSADDQVR